MFKPTKAGNTIGTLAGVISGLIAYNKGKKASAVIITSLIFAGGGYLLGNAITKFYE